MPTPMTRDDLVERLGTSYEKLRAELDAAGPRAGKLACVDDWRVKDLLAVRTWWTEAVADWIAAGRSGETPTTPAPGYRWKDTPRLNAEVVRSVRRESYVSVRRRLDRGYDRIRRTIDALEDTELFEAGVFEWAGKYPIAKWVTMNTARQYDTARTFVRRARRGANG